MLLRRIAKTLLLRPSAAASLSCSSSASLLLQQSRQALLPAVSRQAFGTAWASDRVAQPPIPLTPLQYLPQQEHEPADLTPFHFPVTDLNREPKGVVLLHPEIFGKDIRIDLVHRLVEWERSQIRGWTKGRTKTRGEISGSTRKIYPQKGRGAARHSTRKAPPFRGAGKAHGKRIRNMALTLPKKMVSLGYRTILSSKFNDGLLQIVDTLDIAGGSAKTKFAVQVASLNDWDSTLIIDQRETHKPFELAVRNLRHVNLITTHRLSALKMLKHKKLVLTVDGLRELQYFLMFNRHMSTTTLLTTDGHDEHDDAAEYEEYEEYEEYDNDEHDSATRT